MPFPAPEFCRSGLGFACFVRLPLLTGLSSVRKTRAACLLEYGISTGEHWIGASGDARISLATLAALLSLLYVGRRSGRRWGVTGFVQGARVRMADSRA